MCIARAKEFLNETENAPSSYLPKPLIAAPRLVVRTSYSLTGLQDLGIQHFGVQYFGSGKVNLRLIALVQRQCGFTARAVEFGNCAR
jgi:hypothetical protein